MGEDQLVKELKDLLEKRKAFRGHHGRPGKVGGSLPKGQGSAVLKPARSPNPPTSGVNDYNRVWNRIDSILRRHFGTDVPVADGIWDSGDEYLVALGMSSDYWTHRVNIRTGKVEKYTYPGQGPASKPNPPTMADEPSFKINRKAAQQILDVTFPEYGGRKITVRFSPKITFYDTNWGGGTRNKYAFVSSDGRSVNMKVPAPWLNAVEGNTVPIPENVLVVEHSIFMGKDVGITIWAHPVHLPKWLPERTGG